MLKTFITLLLSLSFLPLSFAQMETAEEEASSPSSHKRFALGITGGIGNLVDRDRVISNFLYSGTYLPLGFHFERRDSDRKLFVSLEFSNNPILKTNTNQGFEYKGDLGEFFPNETDGLNFSTLQTKKYSMSTGNVFLLKKTDAKKFPVYLGYELSLSSFTKKFLQFEYVNDITERVISLGFVLSAERNFNDKHHLEYYLSIPVLNHARRVLSNKAADPVMVEQGKFTAFASVLGFDSRLSYRFQISSKFSLRATYSFRYLQVTFPEKDQWAFNQLVAGLFYHF